VVVQRSPPIRRADDQIDRPGQNFPLPAWTPESVLSQRTDWSAGTHDHEDLAAESLPRGFGLAVFDAWRPLALFTAEGDPPPHLTGGAVDLTLSWQGTPLALGTGFDDFSSRAAADVFEKYQGYVGGRHPTVVGDQRKPLRHTGTEPT
jgi:hypothetical protein